MSKIFHYTANIQPEWIDYNGHMRDAYYGLVFSLAVDAMQDDVGFDEAYRKATGCTIYLLEDHKFYLREVKEGAEVHVTTRVLGCDAKRFHLHLEMRSEGTLAAVCEFMELHVSQRPKPQAAPMPDAILERLKSTTLSEAEASALPHRARALKL